jgi:hypothetical protein
VRGQDTTLADPDLLKKFKTALAEAN